VDALRAFRAAVENDDFPSHHETYHLAEEVAEALTKDHPSV
jgi:hypothetical protein